MSDLVLARNCCLTRMLPGEAELMSERTGLPGETTSVKRFERSNGLDTALYKNYLLYAITNTTDVKYKIIHCSGRNPIHTNSLKLCYVNDLSVLTLSSQ